MIFKSLFVPLGDEDDVLDAGFNKLFDDILHDGFIDDGKHLLGLSFCGREKTRSASGDCNDSLPNFRLHDAEWVFLLSVLLLIILAAVFCPLYVQSVLRNTIMPQK